MRMRRIYLAHPVRGATPEDVDANLEMAKAWVRAIEHRFMDIAIECSWIVECMIWDDSNEEERAAGMTRNKAHVERCDELWMVGDRISNGMIEEAIHARRSGIPVYRLHDSRGEPQLFAIPAAVMA